MDPHSFRYPDNPVWPTRQKFNAAAGDEDLNTFLRFPFLSNPLLNEPDFDHLAPALPIGNPFKTRSYSDPVLLHSNTGSERVFSSNPTVNHQFNAYWPTNASNQTFVNCPTLYFLANEPLPLQTLGAPIVQSTSIGKIYNNNNYQSFPLGKVPAFESIIAPNQQQSQSHGNQVHQSTQGSFWCSTAPTNSPPQIPQQRTRNATNFAYQSSFQTQPSFPAYDSFQSSYGEQAQVTQPFTEQSYQPLHGAGAYIHKPQVHEGFQTLNFGHGRAYQDQALPFLQQSQSANVMNAPRPRIQQSFVGQLSRQVGQEHNLPGQSSNAPPPPKKTRRDLVATPIPNLRPTALSNPKYQAIAAWNNNVEVPEVVENFMTDPSLDYMDEDFQDVDFIDPHNVTQSNSTPIKPKRGGKKATTPLQSRTQSTRKRRSTKEDKAKVSNVTPMRVRAARGTRMQRTPKTPANLDEDEEDLDLSPSKKPSRAGIYKGTVSNRVRLPLMNVTDEELITFFPTLMVRHELAVRLIRRGWGSAMIVDVLDRNRSEPQPRNFMNTVTRQLMRAGFAIMGPNHNANATIKGEKMEVPRFHVMKYRNAVTEGHIAGPTQEELTLSTEKFLEPGSTETRMVDEASCEVRSLAEGVKAWPEDAGDLSDLVKWCVEGKKGYLLEDVERLMAAAMANGGKFVDLSEGGVMGEEVEGGEEDGEGEEDEDAAGEEEPTDHEAFQPYGDSAFPGFMY